MKKETKTKKTKEVADIVEAVETIEEVKAPELTPAELAAIELKKEHKEVFITTVAGIQVVWRKLKRSEYKEAMTTKFNENEDIQYFDRQEFISKKVILFPEDVESLIEDYAGVSDVIATETMIKTGFGVTNTKAI